MSKEIFDKINNNDSSAVADIKLAVLDKLNVVYEMVHEELKCPKCESTDVNVEDGKLISCNECDYSVAS